MHLHHGAVVHFRFICDFNVLGFELNVVNFHPIMDLFMNVFTNNKLTR